MRYRRILGILFLMTCLTACGSINEEAERSTASVKSDVTSQTETNCLSEDNEEEISITSAESDVSSSQAETSCPFDDISEDKVRLMSPAYAPYLLEISEDTTRILAEAMKTSTWEMTDNDKPIPDGEAYSVFVYNSGQPFRLTFYGDYTVDYEQGSDVQKYNVEGEAFLTVFNSANPENPDGISEQLVWCEPENITPDGVWKTVQTIAE